MPKKTTIDDLAKMMKKDFDETHGLIKLTRLEMVAAEEQKEIKTTVDSIWKMLDDEARFIQQTRWISASGQAPWKDWEKTGIAS